MSELQRTIINKWEYKSIIKDSGSFEFDVRPNIKYTKPDFLCKYYSLNDNNIDALTRNYFFASHPFHLNDAFDCFNELIDLSSLNLNDYKIILSKLYTDKKIEDKFYNDKQFLEDILLRTVILKRLYAHIGILSLSTNPLNLLMWSYYSGKSGF